MEQTYTSSSNQAFGIDESASKPFRTLSFIKGAAIAIPVLSIVFNDSSFVYDAAMGAMIYSTATFFQTNLMNKTLHTKKQWEEIEIADQIDKKPLNEFSDEELDKLENHVNEMAETAKSSPSFRDVTFSGFRKNFFRFRYPS